MSEDMAARAPTLQSEVADRLDTVSSARVRIWAPVLLGAIMMGDSWDIGVIGYVVPSLRAEWGLLPVELGWIASAGFAGQLVGALLFGPLGERFGRVPMLSLAVSIMCAFSLGLALTDDPQMFIVMRLIQGVGIGGAAPLCATYINELAPTATRGRYFSLFQFLMVAGFSLCGFVGAAIIPTYGWRIMFLIGAFPLLLVPFVMLVLPESPRWLAGLGRREAVDRALARLGAEPVAPGVEASFAPRVSRIPLAELWTRDLRGLTFLTCLLWFSTSIISYGISTWTPTFYVDNFGLSLEQSLRYSALTGVAYMLAPLAFAALIDKVGRRPAGRVVSFATLLIMTALVLLGESHATASIVLLALAWVAAGSCFVLLWPYTGEVFPTRVRATGVGLCSGIARLGSTVTQMIVGGTLASTGSIRAVFAVFGAVTVVVFLLWMFGAREMAGRRLDEDGEAAPATGH